MIREFRLIVMRPAPGERMAIRPHCSRGAEVLLWLGRNGDSALRGPDMNA